MSYSKSKKLVLTFSVSIIIKKYITKAVKYFIYNHTHFIMHICLLSNIIFLECIQKKLS